MDRPAASPTSGTPAPDTDAVAVAAGLHEELRQARTDLERLTAEYDELLADSDAIQEDRDGTRTLVETARGHVQDLEQAIARIESGTYGRCSKCGGQIAPARLEALPDTETCINCG